MANFVRIRPGDIMDWSTMGGQNCGYDHGGSPRKCVPGSGTGCEWLSHDGLSCSDQDGTFPITGYYDLSMKECMSL
jgi:hypothetical protein